jgi:hypothetical protein
VLHQPCHLMMAGVPPVTAGYTVRLCGRAIGYGSRGPKFR